MNRHERRAFEKKVRQSVNKQEMLSQLQATKAMYDQQVLEMEQLRRRALATQFALLAVLVHAGPVEVPDEVIEEVQNEEWDGWRSSEGENGLVIEAVKAEDDAE